MTFGGWITFLLSTGAFTALLIWCVYKVISTSKKTDSLHGAFDIDEIEKTHINQKKRKRTR